MKLISIDQRFSRCHSPEREASSKIDFLQSMPLAQIRINVFAYLDLVLQIEAYLHKKSEVARSGAFLIH